MTKVGTTAQRARALQMFWLDYTDEQIAARLTAEAPHGSRIVFTAEQARDMRQQAYAEQRAS